MTVCFYNVGIQAADVEAQRWPNKQERVMKAMIKASTEHKIDMFCQSELGSISTGLAAELEMTVDDWISGLLERFMKDNVGAIGAPRHRSA